MTHRGRASFIQGTGKRRAGAPTPGIRRGELARAEGQGPKLSVVPKGRASTAGVPGTGQWVRAHRDFTSEFTLMKALIGTRCPHPGVLGSRKAFGSDTVGSWHLIPRPSASQAMPGRPSEPAIHSLQTRWNFHETPKPNQAGGPRGLACSGRGLLSGVAGAQRSLYPSVWSSHGRPVSEPGFSF